MHTLSASELSHKFKTGHYTAQEITQHFLHRIEKIDPHIGAFLEVYHSRVLQQAQALDEKKKRGEPLGKLAAIPIALKDNIHVKGERTTCASTFLRDYTAPFSATVTELLEKEDALILGKTNLDEFAMGSSVEHSAFQQTFNPWNPQCTPGGSSGGSAAAVAARLCPIALGSDTGGSIRQPASFCGTLGFKPTYGRVSRFGLVAFASSLDQIGPFTNYPEDLSLCMEVLSQYCEKDSTSVKAEHNDFSSTHANSIKGKTLGVPYHLLKELPVELQENFKASLQKFEEMGVSIQEIQCPTLRYAVAIYYILATAEASTNLARFDGIRYGTRSEKAHTLEQVYDYSKEEGFGKEVKRRILLGTYVLSSGYQEAYYKKAQKVRALMIEEFRTQFQHCDAIAMPVTPSTAFELGSVKDGLEMYLADTYTIPANLAGLPAISLPSGYDKEGKPLAIQLLGPQMHDQEVCQFAYHFSKKQMPPKKLPQLCT